jgi:proline iminopeptidase
MSQCQGIRIRAVLLVFLATACANNKEQSTTTFVNQEPKSGIVTVEGAKLSYSVEGSGLPCIVIGVPKLYPRVFSEQLREHFRFVFSDDRLEVPYDPSFQVSSITMDTLSEDIETVRRNLGFDKICVLGHSIHGVLALEYARRYPEHTSHVIVIGGVPYMSDRNREITAEFWEDDASEERKAILKRDTELMKENESSLSLHEAFLNEIIANNAKYWFDPTYDSVWLWQGVEFSDESFDLSSHFMDVVVEGYSVTEGHEIGTPVFLAVGRYDYAVPYTLWNDVRENIPNLDYHLFERSGHYPMLEEQALFDEKLIAWIKRNE